MTERARYPPTISYPDDNFGIFSQLHSQLHSVTPLLAVSHPVTAVTDFLYKNLLTGSDADHVTRGILLCCVVPYAV